MLNSFPSDSPFKAQHIEVFELVHPVISTYTSDVNLLEWEKSSKKGGRLKIRSKKKASSSPAKVQAIKRTKVGESFQQDSQIDFGTKSRSQPTHPYICMMYPSISQNHSQTLMGSLHIIFLHPLKGMLLTLKKSIYTYLEHTHLSLSNQFFLHKHDLWTLP